MITDSGRKIELDKKIEGDVSSQEYTNILFTRLVAKDCKFHKVSFDYCIFDTCYLRNCSFDSCSFIGCRFQNSNLHGSSFIGCNFDYATFEKTQIDTDVLESNCPSHENLKMRFARSLRVNYQQIGDASAANQAITVELNATETYLHKAWNANDRYYRYKYRGWDRLKMFLKWSGFKALDYIWGNGESAVKLLRSVLAFFFFIYLCDEIIFSFHNENILSGLLQAPKLFFIGKLEGRYYPEGFIAFITFMRLALFALFMSIIIKRFNRR